MEEPPNNIKRPHDGISVDGFTSQPTEKKARFCETDDEADLSYPLLNEEDKDIGSSSVISTDSLKDNPYFCPEDLDEWTYENQAIAAPMVRTSTLPFRLTCKAFGCQMIYSEEIIAKKLSKCVRVVGDNGLISFIERERNLGSKVLNQQRSEKLFGFQEDGDDLQQLKSTYANTAARVNESNPVLVTYPHERLVLQMGVCNGVEAAEAAQVVQRDVRAVDVNMGCPKLFSLQGAMGAALLTRPEVVEDIIKSLRRNVSLPVTAKIRMLPDARDTVELVRRLEQLGVSAIGVHCRFREDRPRFRSLPLHQAPLVTSAVHVPILYNGDVYTWNDIDRFRHSTGASSVLIARGAMWNPSVFGGNGRRFFRGGAVGDFSRCYYGVPAGAPEALAGLPWPDLARYLTSIGPDVRPLTPIAELLRQPLPTHVVAGVPVQRPDLARLLEDPSPRRSVPDAAQYSWAWADEADYVRACTPQEAGVGAMAHDTHMAPLIASAYMYSRLSHAVGNNITNAKYFLLEMLKPHHKVTVDPHYQHMHCAKSYLDLQTDVVAMEGNPVVAGPYRHPHPPNKFAPRPHDLYKDRARGRKGKREAQILRAHQPGARAQDTEDAHAADAAADAAADDHVEE